MKKYLTRRELLTWMAASSAAALAACTSTELTPTSSIVTQSPTRVPSAEPTAVTTASANPSSSSPSAPTSPPPQAAYMSIVHGSDPAAITEAALKSIGGIERFVKSGFDVIIKPNICTDYHPYEYGATTNPVVVATLVKLALGAGARRVRVMDFPFGGSAESAYAKSGIADAVASAGGEMELMNPNKFRSTAIPEGASIKEWPIYQDVLNCDLLIDVPIAKHHSSARVTVGCKNLLGVIQNRGGIHADMTQRIPDLVSVVRPGLTVVDAVRTLMRHGPTGGNLDDVMMNNRVIASHDIVAADAYAATLLGLTGADVPYIANAASRGLGVMDLTTIKVEELTI